MIFIIRFTTLVLCLGITDNRIQTRNGRLRAGNQVEITLYKTAFLCRPDKWLPALWRRLDVPGYESCPIFSRDSGWHLDGAALLNYEGSACRLNYLIACDREWVTQSAIVSGWVGTRIIDMTVTRDASGRWSMNGTSCPKISGCVDVDLNFSPSTNLLPIRRLELAIGQKADVRAAWLRFPTFELEPLEQLYARIADLIYRYVSGGGRFVTDVTVDAQGLVLNYGEIWSRGVAA